jgi:hypothetical protein
MRAGLWEISAIFENVSGFAFPVREKQNTVEPALAAGIRTCLEFFQTSRSKTGANVKNVLFLISAAGVFCRLLRNPHTAN